MPPFLDVGRGAVALSVFGFPKNIGRRALMLREPSANESCTLEMLYRIYNLVNLMTGFVHRHYFLPLKIRDLRLGLPVVIWPVRVCTKTWMQICVTPKPMIFSWISFPPRKTHGSTEQLRVSPSLIRVLDLDTETLSSGNGSVSSFLQRGLSFSS